jgi:hypothetical protein
MTDTRLLATTAAVEVATGIALILMPGNAAALLLAQPLDATGIAVARLAGIALLSLGLTCWLGRGGFAAAAGMLAYNGLATAYLALLGLTGAASGPLLWPAVILHAVLSVLLLRAALSGRGTAS